MSLRRILRAVGGLDPVNFAPALLPGYARAGSPPAEISDEAWSFFMTTLRDAGPQFPLKQAWRDVRDVARKRGCGRKPSATPLAICAMVCGVGWPGLAGRSIRRQAHQTASRPARPTPGLQSGGGLPGVTGFPSGSEQDKGK